MFGQTFSCDGEVYRWVGSPRGPTPDAAAAGQFEAVSAAEARRLMRQWWSSGHRRTVAALSTALADRPIDGAYDGEAMLSALCIAAERAVLMRQVPPARTVDVEPPPTALLDLLPPESAPQEAPPEHFVELTFDDGDGQPVAFVACRIELPDGSIRHARSNESGAIRIDGLTKPGDCVVTFAPDDEDAAAATPGPPVSPPALVEQTFELTLVDEVGEPIAGAELRLSGTSVATVVTDDDGRAVLPGESVETCMVEVDFEALREELAARWDTTRPGAFVEDSEEATVRLFGDDNPVLLFAGEPHVVSLQPRVDRLLAQGLFFDTSKSFLLPSALPAMRTVVEHEQRMPDVEVLVVGHTDRAGGPHDNHELSTERAEAMAAFLQDDVEVWLDWYGSGVAWDKRWGVHEDSLMLAALPDFSERPPTESAVRWFQRTRGLQVDGVAGDETRRALIRDYMAIDGTTLPSATAVTTHGCGESFPSTAGPDGTASQLDRRVEIFFFRKDLGIQPPPPAATSEPNDPEYPEWVRRAVNTLEEEIEDVAEALRWREGAVDDAGEASFVIRDLQTDEHEHRNVATAEHDLSKLSDERVVELGVSTKDDLAPVRHRHRVDVGKLRAALRLSDQALLREALSLVVKPAAVPPSLPPASSPWEGEPISEIQPAGEF